MAINDGYEDRETFIPVATPIDVQVGPLEADANSLRLEQLSRSRALLHLILLTAAFVLFQTAAIVVLLESSGESATTDSISASAALVISIATGWFVASCGTLLTLQAGGSLASIGLSLKRWPIECAWGLLIGAISLLLSFAVNLTIFALWPEGSDQMVQNQERIKEIIPPMPIGWLFLTVLLAVIWEEVVFRGILLTHLRRIIGNAGWPIPIILSSAVFGSLHIGGQVPVAAISLFIVGAVWSVAMIWRGSIVACAVGHLVFNASQLLMVHLVSHYMSQA